MEDIKIIYENVEETVLINYFLFKIFKTNNEKGKFIIENDILKIKWESKEREEVFIKCEKEYEDQVTSFRLINNNNDINIDNDNNHTKIFFKLFINDNIEEYTLDDKYEINIIDENNIDVKIDNINRIFSLKDNIYYDITNDYNDKILIKHITWEDQCLINKYNNILIRLSNLEEKGRFEMTDKKIIIFWEKWDPESFFLENDNIYCFSHEKLEDNNEIMLYHVTWSDLCEINFKNLCRKSNNESGVYKLENNILTVYWDNWDSEIFYELNNIYYSEELIKFLNYDNKEYIINELNNKIYKLDDSYVELGNIYFYGNTIEIEWNNRKDIFYYKFDKKNIIIYVNYLKELILFKKFEEKIEINQLNDEAQIKGINYNYILDNDKLILTKDDIVDTYIYSLKDDKYYYEEYLKINSKKILLINKDEKIYCNINIFYNYIYTDNFKINFIENNDIYFIIKNNILEKFYWYEYNDFSFLIIENLYNLYFKEDQIDINIYKLVNNIEEDDLDKIYLNWINNLNSNKIFSTDTFLKINKFFNIDNYINNNYLEPNKYSDAIIHFIKNRTNIYFYSNENIEIIYDNIIKKDLKYEIYDSDTEETSSEKNIRIYDDIIFIINLEDETNIEEILSYIPKRSNVIINVKVEKNRLELIDNIINNFKNLVITKSHNLINYYILEFITNNILKNKNIYSDNIIYINNYYENFYEMIINIPINKRNIIYLFNNQEDNINTNTSDKLNYFIDYNYLYELLQNESFNKIDTIQILIFYYIIKKNVYQIGNNNILISTKLLNRIIENIFSKEILILF